MPERGPNPCAQGHLGDPEGTLSPRRNDNCWEITDARGISCGYVCRRCEQWKIAGYRPEIFEGLYEADEPIEESGW